jgi:hypothetical protein
MAAVMTYDSLVDDIKLYLERVDEQTVAQIPRFIMLAEQVIASQIKFLGNMVVQESSMTADDPTIAKPARWHKTVSMNVIVGSNRQPVFLRKYEYLRNFWPDATQTNVPQFYADYDYTHWLVAPTPNESYNFEVVYYERIQPLDSTNQTNWFTQYAPQALLYGSLLQAMPYLKNDERIPVWQQQYEAIMTTLKSEDATRNADRQAIAIDG